MESEPKPTTLELILGRQAITVLHEAGINNLHVEEDGSVSGSISVVRNFPVTDYLRNLSIQIRGDKIVINGEIYHSEPDLGKVW